MTPALLVQILHGPFNFLRLDPEEVRSIFPDLDKALPMPRQVYLEDESATPLLGFPILLSDAFQALRQALTAYVLAEEAMQLSGLRRGAPDLKAHAASWDRYAHLLQKAVENATLSSYGRQYPAVFWLQHSLDIARLLKETPKRMVRQDTELGRRHGDAIKYRIFDRLMDRLISATYDLVQKVAGVIEEAEEELFSRMLTRMRDNVLILTEDHISRDLSELGSYFNGSLNLDGRDLRRRLDALAQWHAATLESDREVKKAVVHLLHLDPKADGRDLLLRPGYVSYLASLRSYNPVTLLAPVMVQVWESLLVKLKEFEIFHALRRMLLPIESKDGALVCRELPAARGPSSDPVRFSAATRPLDFLAPWVVDPRVERYGMIYDISDFSQTLSLVSRGGNESQDEAFRQMFRFQRRVNRLGRVRKVKLEKYLGDGAFFSSREALNLLFCAVHIQRLYVKAVDEGLPFDRGMRIALNYGAYRLIPMGSGRPGEPERYEFFGPGLVELSRLTTGKSAQEIDEVKTMLISQGYPEPTVHRFFAPLAQKNVDVVDKKEEARRFYAYINPNGTLHNNGIVGTGPYVSRLDRELGEVRLFRGEQGERSYIVVHLEDGQQTLPVGVRKLGLAHLKGLEKLAAYEIVDADAVFGPDQIEEVRGHRLMAAVERDSSGVLSRRP
jgi:hypothetical protein